MLEPEKRLKDQILEQKFTTCQIVKWNFLKFLAIDIEILQRVRIWNKFLTKCQIYKKTFVSGRKSLK